MKLRFLGTGTSTGIPVIGCGCATCTSSDPRDSRMRASLLVDTGAFSFLIDSGPDFRVQALRVGLNHLDHVVYTHGHADHVLGLDDLRPLSYKKGIDIWADGPTMGWLKTIFSYVFSTKEIPNSRPRLRDHVIRHGEAFSLGNLPIIPLAIGHGTEVITGYRWGRVAYITDCSQIPEATWPLLENLDLLVLGALRHEPHPTHFNVDQAVAAARRIRARRTLFTHICHDLGHQSFADSLPDTMAPAYDGLEVEVEG